MTQKQSGNLAGKTGVAWRRLTAYFSILNWLAGDVYRNFKKRFWIIQMWQALVVFLTVGIGGTIYLLLSNFEKGSISFAGFEFEFGNDSSTLIIVFLMVGVLLFLQAYVRYLSEISINRVCILYEEFNVKKALKKVTKLKISGLDKLSAPISHATAMSMIHREPRFCAIAQRMLLRSLVPIVTLFATLMFMLYLNPIVLFGVVAFVMIFATPAIYLNLRAIAISRDFEIYAPRLSQAKSVIVSEYASLHNPSGRINTNIAGLFDDSDARKFMDIFESRINIVSQANVMGGSLMAAAVAVITGIIAWQVVTTSTPWSSVIIYFVALQLIFQSLQRIMSLVTSVNRLFVPITRFHKLMTMELDNTVKYSMGPDGLDIPINCPDGFKGNIEIAAGNRYFFIGFVQPERFSIYNMFHHLYQQAGADKAGLFDALGFAVHKPLGQKMQLRHALGIDVLLPSSVREEISAFCTSILGRAPDFPDSFDSFVSPDDITDEELFVGRCAVLSITRSDLVVLDQRGLIRLETEQVEQLFSSFSTSCVVVYAIKHIQPSKTWGVEHAYTHNGTCFTNMIEVEWAIKNREKLLDITKPQTTGGEQESDLMEMM